MTTLSTHLLLAFLSTAAADPFSLEALLDDTAAPPTDIPAPNAEWPTVTFIDQVTQSIKLEWPTKEPESLTMMDVVQIQLARAWDEEPNELFAVLRDGRRITLSRGDPVQQHVNLMRVWMADRIVELPVGEGHSSGMDKAAANPQLKLTAAGATMMLGKLENEFEKQKTNSTTNATESKRPGSCVNCIDKRDVDLAVKMRMDKIRECYQRELRRHPTLSGALMMSFVAQRDGTVGSATVKQSSINNAAVEACVREQFLLMRFVKPPGNQTISVNYPIVFASG